MLFHRVLLVAVATVFSVGMTSLASACCGFEYSAPVPYAAAAPVGFGGCGGCGAPTAAAVYAAPVAPVAAVAPAPIGVTAAVTPFGGPCCNWNGCGDCLVPGYAGCGGGCGWQGWGGCGGGCGWGGWSWGRSGCGGCGGCGGCTRVVGYAAAPLYVVNQGPVYAGPGFMMPYQTYSPDTAYAPAADYPYVPGYGSPAVAGYPINPGYGYGPAPAYAPLYHHLYVRPHYAGYARPYVRPRYYPAAAPRWRHYP